MKRPRRPWLLPRSSAVWTVRRAGVTGRAGRMGSRVAPGRGDVSPGVENPLRHPCGLRLTARLRDGDHPSRSARSFGARSPCLPALSRGGRSFLVEMFTGDKKSVPDGPAHDTLEAGSRPVLSVLGVLAMAVVVAVVTGWLCRNRCPHRSHTGEARAAGGARSSGWGEPLQGAALTGSSVS